MAKRSKKHAPLEALHPQEQMLELIRNLELKEEFRDGSYYDRVARMQDFAEGLNRLSSIMEYDLPRHHQEYAVISGVVNRWIADIFVDSIMNGENVVASVISHPKTPVSNPPTKKTGKR